MPNTFKYSPSKLLLLVGVSLALLFISNNAISQDSTKSKLDLIKNNKYVKKINSVLDSNQKRINNTIYGKADSIKNRISTKANTTIKRTLPLEEDRPLPYERLLEKKYTLGRRAYQNTVAQFNYFFYAEEELKEAINKARLEFQEDYSALLPFYDYELSAIAKTSIDSIIYRCNANIVFHDLRNNWIDDSYLLLAKAYLYHKNFDTAGSILQFINYSFDEKENGADLPIGSNLRSTKGQFSIATKESNRIWENQNVRNESIIWQARNFFEIGELNEGISLLQLLKSDAKFPKRLYPFLYEQLAYGYYQMDIADSAANYLVKALPNATDNNAKARWYFLIAQLYEKKGNTNEALHWYQKAMSLANNPILGVYAKIKAVNIESSNANNRWEELAATLERMTRREKYMPYSDIIYFEMAKLAVQNKAYDKATYWLITSIKRNYNGLKQKQKAFELLGEINYNTGDYRMAKIAYDSLNGVLKTNPNFDKINLRKKWIGQIVTTDQIIQKEDSLQAIYLSPFNDKETAVKNLQKNINTQNILLKNLFSDKIETASIDYPAINQNSQSNFQNGFNNETSSFYFENKNTVAIGKQNFIQKWGERPNVDNWRRKTSGNIAYNTQTKNNTVDIASQSANTNTTLASNNNKQSASTVDEKQKNNTDTLIGLSNKTDFNNSILNREKNALAIAQIFLLQLNDFDKALPYYLSVIRQNSSPINTERAYLDLASQFIHEGKNKIADSIIKIVELKYPNGYYLQKKNEAARKQTKNQATIEDYKEAFFLSQIGNWDSLANLCNTLNTSLLRTKWYTPFQFLKVKMYAQQRKDSLAISLLDSIVLLNQNESIREKAKNITTQLKKRKETEAYLSNLKIVLPEQVQFESIDSLTDKTVKQATLNKDANTKKDTLIKSNSVSNKSNSEITPKGIQFTHDSLDTYYMSIVTKDVKEVFVKEAKNAFNIANAEDYKKLHLNVTHVQFEQNTYIIWVGPFENEKEALNYVHKIRPRLKEELISFIPTKQYEIYLISKSNIVLIKNTEDLKAYQEFMFKNIYK